MAAKNGATTSEVLAAYASWGAVHGNSAAYTRMALTLVDKVLSGNFKKLPQQQPVSGGSGKGSVLSPVHPPAATAHEAALSFDTRETGSRLASFMAVAAAAAGAGS